MGCLFGHFVNNSDRCKLGWTVCVCVWQGVFASPLVAQVELEEILARAAETERQKT